MSAIAAPAACTRPCCGGRVPTMSDYIDAGLRRRRRAPLPLAGAPQRADDEATVRFSLALDRDVIADVTFQSTACVTLVAYCELLCERVQGLTPAEALRALHPQTLADALPLVPIPKRPRALLAAQALASTLLAALKETRA